MLSSSLKPVSQSTGLTFFVWGACGAGEKKFVFASGSFITSVYLDWMQTWQKQHQNPNLPFPFSEAYGSSLQSFEKDLKSPPKVCHLCGQARLGILATSWCGKNRATKAQPATLSFKRSFGLIMCCNQSTPQRLGKEAKISLNKKGRQAYNNKLCY